jgi:RNA polymerase sigma-70 factor (ECF subfamily)
VDELMPEVALLAWQKFSTLAEQRAFPQWACIIARYEVLRRRRDKAHDRLVLDDDVIAKLADEAETARDERQRQMAALERRERPKSSRRRGRTPDNAAPDGRAYNNRGYTMWRQAAE